MMPTACYQLTDINQLGVVKSENFLETQAVQPCRLQVEQSACVRMVGRNGRSSSRVRLEQAVSCTRWLLLG